MINFLFLSAGAVIGLMVSSLLSINTINDEREAAYKRGYARGLCDGEGYNARSNKNEKNIQKEK